MWLLSFFSVVVSFVTAVVAVVVVTTVRGVVVGVVPLDNGCDGCCCGHSSF